MKRLFFRWIERVMDRKSSIFIVSFFGYIQVTSHRKVGGKVGKDHLGSKQNFKSLSLTSGAVSWNSQHYRQCTEAKCYLFSQMGRGDFGYKLLNCTQATSKSVGRRVGTWKAGKNDFDESKLMQALKVSQLKPSSNIFFLSRLPFPAFPLPLTWM